MALVTSNQYDLVPDINPFVQELMEGLGQRRQAKQEQLQQELKTTGAQLLRIRNMESDTEKRRALRLLAESQMNRGHDPAIYNDLLAELDPDLLNTKIMQVITRATDADKQLNAALNQEMGVTDNKLQFGGQVEFKDEEGNIFFGTTIRNPQGGEQPIVSNITAADGSGRQPVGKLNIVGGTGQTAEQKLETDVERARRTEEIKTREDRIREEARKQAAIDWDGRIAETVEAARSRAKAKGEAFNDAAQMEAALPELMDVVGRLKELSQVATYTVAGRVWDAAMRELGFGATEGGKARAEYIAVVANQVLPLLKPTFGGSFTVQEGEELKATLGNPNLTPEEKQAQLEAFIQQKIRNVRGKQRESGTDELTPEEMQELEQLRQMQGNL